jgi:hypothetical protein
MKVVKSRVVGSRKKREQSRTEEREGYSKAERKGVRLGKTV